MANILTIAASSQVYLQAIYDASEDKFDVVSHEFGYANAVTIPAPVGNWSLDEAEGNRRDDAIGGRSLGEQYHSVQSTTGKLGDCAYLPNNYDVLQWSYDDEASPNAPFPLGATKFTLAVWMNRKSTGNSTGSGVYFNDVNGSRGGFLWTDASGLQAVKSQVASPTETKYLNFTVTAEAWHLCICWWDQTDQIFYAQVDNGEVQSIATTQTWTDNILNIYVYNYCTSDSGFMADQFALWNVILTQGQRTALWNGGAGKTL